MDKLFNPSSGVLDSLNLQTFVLMAYMVLVEKKMGCKIAFYFETPGIEADVTDQQIEQGAKEGEVPQVWTQVWAVFE
jgi:hypothetical protein